jgi:hypothetical protein
MNPPPLRAPGEAFKGLTASSYGNQNSIVELAFAALISRSEIFDR